MAAAAVVDVPTHGFSVRDPPRVSSIEANLRAAASHQQIADFLRYQQESAAVSSVAAPSLEHSPMVSASPYEYATTDRSSLVVSGLLRHEQEMALQQTQEDRQLQAFRSHNSHLKPPPSQAAPSLTQEESTEGSPLSQREEREQSQSTFTEPPVSHSDQMAALLSVSAQRRREEELALLLELSKPKGVDV
jgi:hypothetical protein